MIIVTRVLFYFIYSRMRGREGKLRFLFLIFLEGLNEKILETAGKSHI